MNLPQRHARPASPLRSRSRSRSRSPSPRSRSPSPRLRSRSPSPTRSRGRGASPPPSPFLLAHTRASASPTRSSPLASVSRGPRSPLPSPSRSPSPSRPPPSTRVTTRRGRGGSAAGVTAKTQQPPLPVPVAATSRRASWGGSAPPHLRLLKGRRGQPNPARRTGDGSREDSGRDVAPELDEALHPYPHLVEAMSRTPPPTAGVRCVSPVRMGGAPELPDATSASPSLSPSLASPSPSPSPSPSASDSRGGGWDHAAFARSHNVVHTDATMGRGSRWVPHARSERVSVAPRATGGRDGTAARLPRPTTARPTTARSARPTAARPTTARPTTARPARPTRPQSAVSRHETSVRVARRFNGLKLRRPASAHPAPASGHGGQHQHLHQHQQHRRAHRQRQRPPHQQQRPRQQPPSWKRQPQQQPQQQQQVASSQPVHGQAGRPTLFVPTRSLFPPSATSDGRSRAGSPRTNLSMKPRPTSAHPTSFRGATARKHSNIRPASAPRSTAGTSRGAATGSSGTEKDAFLVASPRWVQSLYSGLKTANAQRGGSTSRRN